MPSYVNYNPIAYFYDDLCQLVFGQSVKNAQIESLRFIPPNSTILIVGGGTGWILDEITKIYPSGLRITYIDNSSKMIQLSKKRNSNNNAIEFIQESIESIHLPDQIYDVVLTPFLFDGFSQLTSQFIFQKLDGSLKINGRWLYIDFFQSKKSKYWQIITLKLMYLFFRLICKIETNKLPSIIIYFSSYKLISEKTFCKDFIITQVFQKMKH